MFIGHFAVGLAAKRVARQPSLGTYFLAVEWTDLIWPIFLALGVESVAITPGATAVAPLEFLRYPLSHSLLADLGWAAIIAGVYLIQRKDRRGAVVLADCVLSHWVLDVIAHTPDMPLYPGGPRVGLGLWNSVPGTIVVEGALFAAGVWVYVRTTRPRDTVGSSAFWSLIGLLVVSYLLNLFGPPPPSIGALEGAAFLVWVFVPWGWWIDRHREPRTL